MLKHVHVLILQSYSQIFIELKHIDGNLVLIWTTAKEVLFLAW